jgi:Holliday junction resolvasome RuvABC endonuclease subunit
MNEAVSPPRVIGLDLSLNSTGVADSYGGAHRLRPGDRDGIARVAWILDELWTIVDRSPSPDLAVIEGYAYAASARREVLGELGGVIRWNLYTNDIPFVVVAPSTLKKFATGKGTGGKAGVLVAARERLGYAGLSDDEADAIWLRMYGLGLLGACPVTLPALNRSALDTCADQIIRR